jgi:hypothetical protein
MEAYIEVMQALSRKRILAAFAIAVMADVVQILLGPLGWTFADEITDVIAMGLIIWLLGFHPLLLPTFIIELVPLIDMLPTWTGCVAAVVMVRRNASRPGVPSSPEEPGVSGGPIYSETGEPQPPPPKEPRNITPAG